MYRRRFHDKLSVHHDASMTHTCLIMTPRATIKSHTCHLMEQPCRNQRTACCNRDTPSSCHALLSSK